MIVLTENMEVFVPFNNSLSDIVE